MSARSRASAKKSYLHYILLQCKSLITNLSLQQLHYNHVYVKSPPLSIKISQILIFDSELYIFHNKISLYSLRLTVYICARGLFSHQSRTSSPVRPRLAGTGVSGVARAMRLYLCVLYPRPIDRTTCRVLLLYRKRDI